MAALLARPHTHLSNRAKVRSALERKPVFKSVLENPFQISWPSVPVNVQNTVLARLVAALENILLRAPHELEGSGDIAEETEQADIHTNTSWALDGHNVFSASPVVGINQVTRALELQLCLRRKHAVVNNRSPNDNHLLPRSTPLPISVVFVCCADVDPASLIDHIPYLVAGYNSPRSATQPIKLIPLPKGSEPAISQTLGIRRAAVVAFRCGSPLFETFQDILDTIPTVSAPWLCPSDTLDTTQLVPTHIKQLRTSAPKDIKGAREQRAKARKKVSGCSRSIRRKPRVTLTTRPESAMEGPNL